jgi:PKD repeat protein
MKTIYSFLLTALILFVFLPSLKAQKQEICEGETASFRLNGYKGGEIVWQKSTDQNNWQDISGTNDTIFEVTVTESLFYRAKVSEGTCKPYYSDTTEIILLPQPITANAGANITDACVPVTLNGNTPSNGTGEWTVVSGSGGSFDDSTSASASFSGNPGVTYTLEWAIGTQCDTTTDQVEVSFIEVDFTADKTTITPGETVSFTDESTGNPTSWSWDFGDGNTSTEENPSHTYTSVGTYTVELTVTNDYGSDTKTKTDYITVVTSPTANFEADQTTITYGETVNFTDQSTGNPTSWSWDFADGSTSTQQNPSHTYNSVGTYTVELTVSNSAGSDKETKTDYINVSVPTIDFNGTTLYVYPEDNSTAIQWGGYGTITDGNGADSDTDGEANTSAIVSQLGSDGHAAYLCDTLSAYGYNDWYLPAKSELNALYQNKDDIGGFSSDGYWSSTEHFADYAWSQNFYSGGQGTPYKYSNRRVRCVRRD